MKLYLSGRMTGLPNYGFESFKEAREALRERGFTVVCPAELGQVDGWTWEDYLRRDLRVLLDCQGIATIDGWEQSRGANLEVDVARRLGMPVQSVDHWLFWADRVLSRAVWGGTDHALELQKG